MSVPFDQPRTVRPNRTKYIHRDIVVVKDASVYDELGIQHNLIEYTIDADPTVYVTLDSSHMLSILDDFFSDLEPVEVTKRDGTVESVHPWNFKLVRTGNREETGRAERVRLDRFGCRMDGKRRQAMHLVWCPLDMSPTGDIRFLTNTTVQAVMRWACDFREFHMSNNLPLSTTFAGMSAKLLRDARFYPDARRQVPRATNERAREFLPGVHQESRASTIKRYTNAVALDQAKAYHNIARQVPMPNANDLYARGYYGNPFDADKYWCQPGDELYDRVTSQPGLLFLGAYNHVRGKNLPFRQPALDFYGFNKLAVWTNELPTLIDLGLQVEGVYAALTSTTADDGIARYAEWALDTITNADETTARWLKPTLHAAYGILGARPRRIRMGFKQGKGEVLEYILGARAFNVHHVETRQEVQPPTANVVALGILQAEVRRRTILLANELLSHKVDVLHIHADGIHAVGQLPFPPHGWTVEPRSNLKYIDNVSWTSDQGDCLPGRSRHTIALKQAARRPLRQHV